MKKLNLNNNNNKDMVATVVTAIGLITVMFYMIVSIRNLIQILMNFSLISNNSGMGSLIFNLVLYLFVIATGFEAVRRSKNPYYIIIALVTVLVIY